MLFPVVRQMHMHFTLLQLQFDAFHAPRLSYAQYL